MRQAVPVLLALLVVSLLGLVGYRWLFAPPARVELELIEARGEVTRLASDGQRAELRPGEGVRPGELVAVGADGAAVLGLGADVRLELPAASAMRVVDVEEAGVRVELEQGRVRARVRAGGGQVSVSNRGRAASANDADFTVAVDEEGLLAIVAERGELRVEGVEGAASSLPAQMLLTSLPGRPGVVEALDAGLRLLVRWPEPLRLRLAELALDGQTGPYLQVTVEVGDQSARVRSNGEGAFRVPLRLALGENPVTVRVRDALGNQREDQRVLVREPAAPSILGTEVQWGP